MKCTRILCSVAVSMLCLASEAKAVEGDAEFGLSLEELTKQVVTSVSKKEERAFEASSAIYVITQEDIKRSTATTLPELLRGVPGIQVSQIDSNVWAVSSRGLTNQFANKMLVLIDGRTIYNPVFSGVYWGNQMVVLEDIDRIEIIRGPGGTLWGANAVNGVINVIMKDSRYTQGTYLSAAGGNQEAFGEGRFGGKIDDTSFFRAYAKEHHFNQLETLSGQGAGDDWLQRQVGFRMDSETNSRDHQFTLQGDTYYSERNWEYAEPIQTFPLTQKEFYDEDDHGGNVLGRWTKRYDDASELQTQAYVDYYARDNFSVDQLVTTTDLDTQYSFSPADRHEMVVGGGYRHIFFQFDNKDLIRFDDTKSQEYIANTFIQDKYAVIPDKVFFTLGSKFEYNSYTDFEVQPSGRLSYLVDQNNTLWTAVSRSVRTPSKADQEISFVQSTFPENALGLGVPSGSVVVMGDDEVKSEKVVTYEVGYRTRPLQTVSFDFTTFYNDYANLAAIQTGAPTFDPDFGFIVPLVGTNLGEAQSYGIEISTNWEVMPFWNVVLSNTYQFIDIDVNNSQTLPFESETNSPEHMASLTNRFTLPHNLTLDTYLHYSDNLGSASAYWRFDTRLGWVAMPGVELSLSGTNLLDSQHPEFSAGLYSYQAQVPRSVLGQVKLNF